jgi:hypothetical protein
MHDAFQRHRDGERRLEPACLCDMTCRIDLTPEVLVCVQCMFESDCLRTHSMGFWAFHPDHYSAKTTLKDGDTAVFIDMVLITSMSWSASGRFVSACSTGCFPAMDL